MIGAVSEVRKGNGGRGPPLTGLALTGLTLTGLALTAP